VSLIYFTKSETETSWFFDEIIMWVSLPILAMVLSFFVFYLIKKHIYKSKDACRIIVRLMPLQITATFTVMFYCAIEKNFLKTKTFREHSDINFFCIVVIMFIIFPICVLPMTRLYLLRRARNLEWISSGRQQKVRRLRIEQLSISSSNEEKEVSYSLNKNLFKMDANYCVDIKNALKFWDTTPLYDAYFPTN